MSGDVTVTSTTDTQEAVDAAASYGKLTVQQPEVETPAEPTSDAEKAETVATKEEAPEEEPKEKPEEEPESEEDEEELEEQAQGKTRRKLLRNISRLNRERYDLRERLDIAEQKIRQYDERAAGKEQRPPADGSLEKPNKDNYTDVDLYMQDWYKWMRQEEEKAEARKKFEQFVQTIDASYDQQVEVSRETHEDFDEVLKAGAPIPGFSLNVIRQMKNGSEVAYYLGTHPEVCGELMELAEPYVPDGAAEIVYRLKDISRQLSNGNGTASAPTNGSPKTTTRPVTRTAPAPIEPVRGGSAKSVTNPDKLPFRDFVKWRMENGASRR